MKVLALSGGVGGAKLARGLGRVLRPGELTVVCNTGDDFEHLGLHISPDLDSVLYAMAGVADPVRGWGRADETWSFMAAIRELGLPDWFNLGDRDLAVHLWRRAQLQQGATLAQIAQQLTQRFGVRQQLLPMSNAAVRTQLHTAIGVLDFQDYFVRQRAAPRVSRIQFSGAEQAAAPLPPRALQPTLIVICPSNPYLSIDPILSIADWRDALRARTCPVVAVSPIVAGDALKGCAAKLMREYGLACEPETVARHYGELLDGFVIDAQDAHRRDGVEALGLPCLVTPSIMHDDADRDALASAVLEFGRGLAVRSPAARTATIRTAAQAGHNSAAKAP